MAARTDTGLAWCQYRARMVLQERLRLADFAREVGDASRRQFDPRHVALRRWSDRFHVTHDVSEFWACGSTSVNAPFCACLGIYMFLK